MLKQETLLAALNKLLNQVAKIRKGTDAVYYCPVCKHYKKKFEVNLINGKYHCWVCNFSGLSFRSLFKKLKASSEYYAILGEVQTMRNNEEWKIDFSEPHNDVLINKLPDEYKPFSIPSNDLQYQIALKYILSRNISRNDVLRHNIGYCDSGFYAHRIIIPSYDTNGNLNFFSARDYLGMTHMKYRLCSFSKNIIGHELLVNFDEPITLVEGQFDAIAVRRNAIPLLGKTMSNKLKVKLLESDVPRVNVLLDNDAKKDAIKICEYLYRNDIPAYLVELPEKDPSLLGFEKTWEYIDKSTRVDFHDLIQMKIL